MEILLIIITLNLSSMRGNYYETLKLMEIMDSYKIELKLKLTKYCVLSAAGAGNNDPTNSNSIIFTTKETKLYVPVVILSAKDNQKLPKRISKGFERSVYWNKYKTKRENKNTTN